MESSMEKLLELIEMSETKREVAEHLGITPRHLSRLIKKDRPLSPTICRLIDMIHSKAAYCKVLN